MTFDWLYKLSDWNPQFFREVKGRLKPRTLITATIVSLVAQAVLLMVIGLDLPAEGITAHHRCTGPTPNSYVAYECLKNAMGGTIVNWTGWWSDVFQIISWSLPFVLLIAGVYLLISDLGKEEQRGTLNFIRLSPQTSHRVLIGKILGVPIVPYLTVAVAIPLHLLAAILGDVPLLFVLSLYLVTLVASAFWFTAALLYSFLGGFQGWVGAIALWFTYSIFFSVFQGIRSFSGSESGLRWFHWSISSNLPLLVTFTVITLAIATYWNWQAINRRFCNPNATLLSKRQSYLATASFEVFLLGFVARDLMTWERPIDLLSMLICLNLAWFLLLIAALTPHRQTVLDWARYRRQRHSDKGWSKTIVQDLLWGEKSPALLAVGMNLLVMAIVILPWLLTWNAAGQQLRGGAALLLNATFLLICAVVAQMMLFLRSQRRSVWALGGVVGLLLLPPTLLATASLVPGGSGTALWLFTGVAFLALEQSTAIAVVFGLLGQLAVLSLLTTRLSRQLQKAGESELKTLIAA